MVGRSKQEMQEKWEREAMLKQKLQRSMEQDLAWRGVKKTEERDQKMEENQNSKVVSNQYSNQKTQEVQQYRVRQDTKKN